MMMIWATHQSICLRYFLCTGVMALEAADDCCLALSPDCPLPCVEQCGLCAEDSLCRAQFLTLKCYNASSTASVSAPLGGAGGGNQGGR